MTRLVPILLLAAVCGCTTIHMNVDKPAGPAAKQSLDGMHYYAVLDLFGPPSQISALPGGFVFLYDSLAEIERQLGVSFGKVYNDIELLKLSFGRATLRPQYFVVIFDEHDTVHAAGLYEGEKKIGGSMMLQVVFTVIPTTDMSYLKVPPVQEDWGLSLTRSLPVGLNASGDFGSGHAGVEVRGAPTAVGQHTLEMPSASEHVRR